MHIRRWHAMGTALVPVQALIPVLVLGLAALGQHLEGAESAAAPAGPAIEQVPGAVGTIRSGYAESSGCVGEDHATWYGIQRHGPLVDLVGAPVGGGPPTRHPLPPQLTADATSWVPLVVAADGSWVVLSANNRLLRWAPASGVVAELLGTALTSWGCQRVPGASGDGTVALRCDRKTLLLVAGAATPPLTSIPVAGPHDFCDDACWCGSTLWSPVVSMDPVTEVHRLLPLAPALHLTVAPGAVAAPGSEPMRIQLLGADREVASLWGTAGGHLLRISVASGVMTVVAPASDPGMLPTTPTTTEWAVDGERQLLLGVTVSSHPSALTSAAEAAAEVSLRREQLPQLSVCQRSSHDGVPDHQLPVLVDLSATWQQLLQRSRQERQHPLREQPLLLLSTRILGCAHGELALALDFEIRYGFFGSVFDAILILPPAAAGTTVTPRLAGFLNYGSSGIATPIHDYPVVTTDPGHALAVQYQDQVLVVPLGAGPPPKALLDPVPR